MHDRHLQNPFLCKMHTTQPPSTALCFKNTLLLVGSSALLAGALFEHEMYIFPGMCCLTAHYTASKHYSSAGRLQMSWTSEVSAPHSSGCVRVSFQGFQLPVCSQSIRHPSLCRQERCSPTKFMTAANQSARPAHMSSGVLAIQCT